MPHGGTAVAQRRHMRKALFIGLASLLSLVAAAPSEAQPAAPLACTKPPPKPEGHILGVVDSIDARGNASIRFGAASPAPKAGNDIHLLTCDGALATGGRSDVDSASGSSVRAVFKSLKNPTQHVGHYVAIDTGHETATPAGVAAVSITNIAPDAAGVKLTLGAGEEDGVFAGAEGTITLRDQRAVKFRVSSTSRSASTTEVRLPTDEARGATRITVALKKPRCFGPKPIDPSQLANFGKAPTPPRGYVFSTGAVDGTSVTVSLGKDARVTPSAQAYVFAPSLVASRVEGVDAKKTTLRLGQTTSARSVRVMLPTLPPAGTCTE